MRTPSLIGAFLLAILALAPSTARAQELVPDTQTIAKAEVVVVLNQESREIPGTETLGVYQTLRVRILEGPEAGKELTVENDYLSLEAGDVFYLTHTVGAFDGRDSYAVAEPYRLPVLWLLGGLFVFLVFAFGGIQGVRGLVSLAGGLALIAYVLLPGILGGYSPLVLTLIVSSLIVVLGSYITHGFNRTTSAAVLGMIATILATGALAHFSVDAAKLSGFSSEESVYLRFGTRGTIDFVGLLFSGILIGLLGVLYDAAIGQAVAVEELHRAGPTLSRRHIFSRALRIGREHIGALVNILAIAYVGASLPLLLLFYASEASAPVLINQEIFAAEIVRTMIGSIGLVLAVPVTTAIAVWMLVREGAPAR